MDKIISDYLQYVSLSAPVLHAAERWQGATLAKDSACAALQLSAYEKYTAMADSAKSVLTNDDLELNSLLTSESLKSFPGGAKAIAAAFNAQCGKSLPANLNTELLSLGESQEIIDEQVCVAAKSVEASNVNMNFEALLAKPVP